MSSQSMVWLPNLRFIANYVRRSVPIIILYSAMSGSDDSSIVNSHSTFLEVEISGNKKSTWAVFLALDTPP